MNLAVFTVAVHGADMRYQVAATLAFLVAVSNNFLWNRHWTFKAGDGRAASPGRALPDSSASSRSLVGLGAAHAAGRGRRDARGAGAGDRDRRRHAAELPRQQALELLSLIRRALVAGARPRARPGGGRARRDERAGARRGGLAGATPITAPCPRRGRSRRPRRARPRGASRRSPPSCAGIRGASVSALRKDGRWVVQAFTPGKDRRQIIEVYVDPYSGRVTEAWTGPQVAWGMARGYPGAFGRSVNSPWIWVTLCVLFVVPFLDVRRPLRLLHLDLLMLVGFSVSLAFFNDANLGLSVPLVVRPARLSRRAARVHRPAPRRRGRRSRCGCSIPWQALALLTLFLVGLRIGLNMIDGNVIDVGYAGVIGADKLAHGRELYGAFPNDNAQGDTYGPLLYLAYVPFELIWPWVGRWNDLPAAHAAAGRLRRGVRRAALPDRPAHPRHRAGRRARVRVGRVPVHDLRDELGDERRAARRARPRRDLRRRRARSRAARSAWRPG